MFSKAILALALRQGAAKTLIGVLRLFEMYAFRAYFAQMMEANTSKEPVLFFFWFVASKDSGDYKSEGKGRRVSAYLRDDLECFQRFYLFMP